MYQNGKLNDNFKFACPCGVRGVCVFVCVSRCGCVCACACVGSMWLCECSPIASIVLLLSIVVFFLLAFLLHTSYQSSAALFLFFPILDLAKIQMYIYIYLNR